MEKNASLSSLGERLRDPETGAPPSSNLSVAIVQLVAREPQFRD
jgi:hypothetical protein